MSIRPETDAIIDYLNGLLAIDRHFMQQLVATQVHCNSDLANHPSVQVREGGPQHQFIREGEYATGILGILNGYCGVYEDGPMMGYGPIMAVFDDGLLVRFERTENKDA